jgi:WD40 repeat protein
LILIINFFKKYLIRLSKKFELSAFIFIRLLLSNLFCSFFAIFLSLRAGPNPTIGSPASQHISTSSVNGYASHYHELISNAAVIRSPIKRYEGHSDACIAAEWFPDGDHLVTASWDRTANVYNVETGKILCNLQHDDYLTNVSIHKTHKIILTSSKDTTFKVSLVFIS